MSEFKSASEKLSHILNQPQHDWSLLFEPDQFFADSTAYYLQVGCSLSSDTGMVTVANVLSYTAMRCS